MGLQRLYEVKVTFTYYAEADSLEAAAQHAPDAWDDAGADSLDIVEVTRADHPVASPWTSDCDVYGAEEPTELGTWLARLPKRPSVAG